MVDLGASPDIAHLMYRYRPTHVWTPTCDGLVSVLPIDDMVDLMVNDMVALGHIDIDDEEDVARLDGGYYHEHLDVGLELAICIGPARAESVMRKMMEDQ